MEQAVFDPEDYAIVEAPLGGLQLVKRGDHARLRETSLNGEQTWVIAKNRGGASLETLPGRQKSQAGVRRELLKIRIVEETTVNAAIHAPCHKASPNTRPPPEVVAAARELWEEAGLLAKK